MGALWLPLKIPLLEVVAVEDAVEVAVVAVAVEVSKFGQGLPLFCFGNDDIN